MVDTFPFDHGCDVIHAIVSAASDAPSRQKLKLPVLKKRPRKS